MSAPLSSSSLTTGEEPGSADAINSGVRPSAERALTSAPRSTQQTRLLEIGDRPHQRRRTAVVGRIRVGALVEQRLHRARRRRKATAYISGVMPPGPRLPAAAAIRRRASSQTCERSPARSASISAAAAGSGGWRRDFAGDRVRPLGPLVDPRLDGGDLRRRQRSGRRHLRTELRSDQLVIQPAAVGIAGADDGDGAAAHRVLAAIEAEARSSAPS